MGLCGPPRCGCALQSTTLDISGAGTAANPWLIEGENPQYNNYTPTLSNWSLGNGTAAGRYISRGNLVIFGARITFGTTSTFTVANPVVSLPQEVSTNTVTGQLLRANVIVNCSDATGSMAQGWAHIQGTLATPLVHATFVSSTGTSFPIASANISSTFPFTWAVNDVLIMYGSYEAA